MIRRRDVDNFHLVTQHDHARLSAALASQIGGVFSPPSRGWQTILGIALHDCGWPLHDDSPTLNEQSQPTDVFETPPDLALHVWEAGAARAEATAPPYSALLVSLHVMSLCASALRMAKAPLDNRRQFAAGQFLNNQAGRQLRLRDRLAQSHGLHTDLPLHLGLVMRDGPGADDAAEQALTYDFRLLQGMDLLSLCLTRDPMPASRLGPLPVSPSVRRRGGERPIAVRRRDPAHFELDPWPFTPPQLVFAVPTRTVPAGACRSLEAFRAAWATAAREDWLVHVRPTHRSRTWNRCRNRCPS